MLIRQVKNNSLEEKKKKKKRPITLHMLCFEPNLRHIVLTPTDIAITNSNATQPGLNPLWLTRLKAPTN